MTTLFNHKFGPVVVEAVFHGPLGVRRAIMAVDTGAVFSLVHPKILQAVGYDLLKVTATQNIMSVTGTASAPSLLVDRVEALGQFQAYFAVTAFALPPTAVVDGLLGLNFFRNLELCLDFRTGQITLR